ncbi:phosphotransferase [Arthrobacter sp. R4-81]
MSKLPGGRGTAWKAGEVTLKPLDVLPQELLWLDEVAPVHAAESRLRLSLPIRSRFGKLIVDGWTAFPYLAGEHRTGRWLEIAEIAREFAALFSDVRRPAFIDMWTHAWARADRFAWSEDHAGPPVDAPYVADLMSARRPLSDPPALIHGDLSGNVLFDSVLPPAVIDLTLYWRPVEYSVAVVAVDAVCFEDAPLSLLETISPKPGFPQHLIRAALFRIVTDHLNGRRTHDYYPYDDAVDRILQLVAAQRCN